MGHGQPAARPSPAGLHTTQGAHRSSRCAPWRRLVQGGWWSALPEPVQVAVGAGGYGLGLGAEGGFGFLPGLQVLAHDALGGEQFYPLNVVLKEHGVQLAAHGHYVAARGAADLRHVLFVRGIGGVLLQEFHGLPAAHEFARGRIDYFNDLAAHGATVHLVTLGHDDRFLGV